MPNRADAVEEFLRTLDHPSKGLVEGVRELILDADERVTEEIKWKVPTFGLNGQDRITFHLRAEEGIGLVLHRGAKPRDVEGFAFEDPEGLLTWPAKDRALLTVRSEDELAVKREAIGRLLLRWMKETTE